jgi:isoquinoline 1-oxidoreductase subunit alpha
MSFTVKINGASHTANVDTPLLWVLRDVLGITGTKFGCGVALCGACIVHVGGVAVRSCSTSIDSIGASEVAATGKRRRRMPVDPAVLERSICSEQPSS